MDKRRQELLEMGRADLDALVDHTLSLERRLALDSSNSGKPPSSDPFEKPAPRSQRRVSGAKAGGQPGHPPARLEPVREPDHERIHRLDRCPCPKCSGVDLRGEPVVDYARRQVFDLPPIRLEVTEHRAEIKKCPVSGLMVQADFPRGVNALTQYGNRFRSLLVYLNQHQLIPCARVGEIRRDLLGASPSPATVIEANRRMYVQLESFEEETIQKLLAADVVHADETGVRVAGDRSWLHVVCNSTLTVYGVHPRRGFEAIEAMNILPRFRGWLVHDFLAAYFRYGLAHAMCVAHLIRELVFVEEQFGQRWARAMIDFLHRAKRRVAEVGDLPPPELQSWLEEYRRILARGRRANPRRKPEPGKARPRGRIKQTKPANLVHRLERHEDNVLAFLHDSRVPFTNNQAERDLRMSKVQRKISGCFRTMAGARTFARIRGFVVTARKQGRNILESLAEAIEGSPFAP